MIILQFLLFVSLAFGQNKIHPTFPILENAGKSKSDISSIEKTCGACHNLKPILENSTHANHNIHVSCLTCHTPTSMKDQKILLDSKGWAVQEWVEKIQRPDINNCLQCHGNSELQNQNPLFVSDLGSSTPAIQNWSTHLMQAQGAFFSAQKISESFLNIENKNDGVSTWDVHAQRQLNCSSCHSTQNNPAQNHLTSSQLKHLKYDIREELPIHNYLKNPDHHLQLASCSSCHDPLSTHEKFPYRSRHLASLSCQSCHIPVVSGPLLSQVDMSVYTEDGNPLMKYWNTDFEIPPQNGNNSAINTEMIRRQTPILLSHEGQIWPYNIIQVRKWVLTNNIDKEASLDENNNLNSNEILSAQQFKEFFWNDKKNQADLIKILDKNQNHKIDSHEWQSPNPERDSFIKSVLAQKGFPNAHLIESKSYIKLGHGILPKKWALQSCEACHGQNSRFENQTKKYGAGLLNSIHPQDPTPPKIDNYVLGTTRNASVDLIGFLGLLFLGVFIAVHASLRWSFAKNRPSKKLSLKKTTIYLYGRYERFWHWTLAFSTSGLLVTGLEIHYPNSFSLFGFRNAGILHNGAAFLFIINSILSLFYYITNSKIRQFIPNKENFWLRIKEQILYYSHGIFRGPQHHEKSAHDKFNPLQQITYLALLNILLPLQMITGALMWAVDKWTFASHALQGYAYLGPIHTAGSWLFLLFLVLHIYLTTTGETPLAHIKSMITGEEHFHRGDE